MEMGVQFIFSQGRQSRGRGVHPYEPAAIYGHSGFGSGKELVNVGVVYAAPPGSGQGVSDLLRGPCRPL